MQPAAEVVLHQHNRNPVNAKRIPSVVQKWLLLASAVHLVKQRIVGV